MIAACALTLTLAADPLSRVEPATSANVSIAAAQVRDRPPTEEARAFWERTWPRLTKLDAVTRREGSWRRNVADLTDIAAERRITSLSRADEDDLFRTRLLMWHLDRLRGRREELLDAPPAGFTWIDVEAWIGVRALRPGPARSTAMMHVLAIAPPAGRAGYLKSAETQVLEELSVGNVEGAADLAARIDALEPTTARCSIRTWTAGQAGRSAAAAAIVTARIAGTELTEEAELHVVRARLSIGRGDELAARADLGAGLAGGAPSAAVLTARLALERGDPRGARVLLRGWLDDPAAGGEIGALWVLAGLDAGPRRPTFGPETESALPVR